MVRHAGEGPVEEISRFLRHGLAPITDSEAALVELGFARAYPGAKRGFESTVWERSVDHGYQQTNGGVRRVFVRQRAFLVRKKS